MKIKSKALLLVLCAVLLVTASGLGTMAYLTDDDSVTNTFTVGSVGLTLDEADVNEKGQPLKDNAVVDDVADADRWQPTQEDPEQEYHLLPGHTYTKDPTVTVDKNSENAYVRMMATITYKAEADKVFADHKTGDLFTPWLDIDGTNWKFNGAPVTTKDDSADTISRTYEFRYVGNDAENPGVVVKSETATVLPALFTTIRVPDLVTKEEIAYLDGMKITVVAHAIQADGFANADAAWTAFGVQHP